jgi:hypothetical protein
VVIFSRGTVKFAVYNNFKTYSDSIQDTMGTKSDAV